MLGQTVYQKQISDTKIEVLHLSGFLNDAVYFISLESGNTIFLRKLIVQN